MSHNSNRASHHPMDAGQNCAHAGYAMQARIDPNAPAKAAGEIRVSASPIAVWTLLADARNWPAIRSDITEVGGRWPAQSGETFFWSTNGVGLTSMYGLIEPGKMLSWTTSIPGLVMVHVYRFDASAEGSTRIRCHESLWAPALAPEIDDMELGARIRSWLEGLKSLAERLAVSRPA